MQTVPATFGSALRWWRKTRGFSQLQLATHSGVSSRHISFLETGRARPSREMVVHLGVALDIPLRDRNELLNEAGFAPVYPHSELDAPEMDDVRAVLRAILGAHSPTPAMVVDRRGDIVDANEIGFAVMAAVVAESSPALSPAPNVNRVTLHPDGIRQRTRNWPAVAANILERLDREVAHRPADRHLGALLDEVLAYPEVAALRRRPQVPTGADLLVPLELETFAGDRLSLVTTIATIGAPYDVTLDELRLETFFPADEATADVLRSWVDGDADGIAVSSAQGPARR